ncbi:MAG: hypothetical protein QOJ79_2250 [Actinomycetota bacterium]|jgi:flavin-dependent dehydrogenase|nr:hypothetical protein [Actinomycetota bacterium]
MELSYDVAIVGARCAGSALARLLAQAGLRVVVIDRARFPSDTHSTACISTTGTELLHAWGVLDEVVGLGAPNLSEVRLSTPSQTLLVPLPPDGHGLVAPRRTVLDKLLVDMARSAGADVWEGTALAGLVGGSQGEPVRGLQCFRSDGALTEVRASVVVGADGFTSRVATCVDAPSYAQLPSACSGVYGYYADSGVTEFGIGLAERRLVLSFPTTGGEVCLVVGGHCDDTRHLSRGGDEAAAAFIEEVAPHVAAGLRKGRRSSRMRSFHPRPGRFRVPHGPGWALVGDAGHYLDPITGQGMSNAFLGAALLSEALVDGLGGARRLPVALAGYQQERDELTMDVHEVTHELAMFGWSEQRGLELVAGYRALAERGRLRAVGLSGSMVAS